MPPTLRPPTANRLDATVKSVISKDKVKSVDLAEGVLTVDYDLTVLPDDGMTVFSMADTLASLAPKVFAVEDVNALESRAFTDFTDVRGNSSRAVASDLKITRSTAASINWRNFLKQNLPRVLIGPGDSIYIHPALRRAWLDFSAGR